MPKSLSRSVVIEAPRTRVWPLIADVRSIEDWHPTVRRVDLLSDAPTGLGATRRCNFYDNGSVVEEVIEHVEGDHIALTLREIKLPMRDVIATLVVKAIPPSTPPAGVPVADEWTQVTMSIEMTPSGCGGSVLWPVVKSKFGSIFSEVLAGLRHYVVTGEKPPKGWTIAKQAKIDAKATKVGKAKATAAAS